MNGKAAFIKSALIVIGIDLALFALVLIPPLLGDQPLRESLWILLVIAAGLLFSLGVFFLSYRHSVKLADLLNRQCDPDAFLDKTRRMLDSAAKWSRPAAVLPLRLNLAAGLAAAGRFHESLAAMPDPSLFKNDSAGRSLWFAYHHNHFADFLALGLLDHARLALLWLDGAMRLVRPGKQLDRMNDLYRQDYYLFEMENGRFHGAQAVFQDAFDRAQHNYERVVAMMNLGRIHAHSGRTDEARAAFQYVIGHGNKLYEVTEAREKLDALNA
jgi:tetratricopeptide (TPR) repeat protein